MTSAPTLNSGELRALAGERFQLLRELGRGGMATVYLADDRALGRQVAIKVVHPALASVLGAERFAQEIQLTARLVHPNIVPLFEAGAAGDILYYVMPYLEGDTLRAQIDTGPMPVEEVVAIARDVVEALGYAHAQQLVHRDIKPENIFCQRGRALVADFGIAKAVDLAGPGNLTSTGLVLGTAAYMSPEQAMADQAIDGRADLYSLGCVLYEMIIGRPPFQGPTMMAVLSRHLTETAKALPAEVPAGLRSLVADLLAKEPGGRPRDAVEVLDRLRVVLAPSPAPVVEDQRPAVAVMPFVNSSPDPDNEYFADGLTDELIVALGGLDGLRVIPRGTVFGMKSKTALDAVQIGAALKVGHIVQGSVRKSGDRVRISVDLTDAAGERVWAERFDRELKDIFAVQDDITARILDALKTRLVRVECGRKPKRFTENGEAYDLYLQGHAYWLRAIPGGPGSLTQLEYALSYFERALALDPKFVPALQGLSDTHSVGRVRGHPGFEHGQEVARDLMRQCIAAGGEWPQTHVSMAVDLLYFQDDFESAAGEITRAVELDPGLVEGQRFYSVVLKILGRDEEALHAVREAVRIEPNAPFVHNALGDQLLTMGRPDEAADSLRTAIRLAGRYDASLERLELACYRAGRMEEAFEARRTLLGHLGKIDRVAVLDEAYQRDGYPAARKADISTQLAEFLATAETQDPFKDMHGSRCLGDRIMLAYAELGDWPRVMDWVEKGYQRRPGRLRRVLTDLPFDRRGLAGDPRYVRLLRTAGLHELL